MFDKFFKALFGTSNKREMQRYRDEVARINQLWPRYKEMTEDRLRGMTVEFREQLAKGASLADIKLDAFAVVREACRRLVGQEWEVRGKLQKWEIVPYDVQMIGGLVLNDGRIAEMATGEGKTLVAVAPLYLNALEGKGAHLVTVNDYLAQRDSEWMGGVFRYLGMTVGVIISDMSPPDRRIAYACDVTYGTNNEFGFDYLRDNMAVIREQLVQRPHHFAIIDEVDSVLIDEARTPLIISGQVDRSDPVFEQWNPVVQKLVKRQTEHVNNVMANVRKAMAELEKAKQGTQEWKDLRYSIGYELLKARKGLPKHMQLQKVLQEVEYLKMLEAAEREVMLRKAMRELEADLYYTVDEKGHAIDLTDMGRELVSPDNPDQYVLGDLVEEFAAIENRAGLGREEKEKLKDEVRRQQEKKQETIHAISQSLRAHSLYERDVDYLVSEEGKIVIIDENTGRQMPGRRWSDGLHAAVEAKENVKVEPETVTMATITLQNFFRMYGKLSGMTGTAETESQEFSHTYQMDVYGIPTNRPVTREDEDDYIFRTKKEKFRAIVDEVVELHKQGLPVLVGTKTVEASELVSRMLKGAKISHSVLNARYHEKESEIVAQAGQPGAVTIATNMAGRGTDIKLGPGVVSPGSDGKPQGGLQIIGTERHDSRRIDRQLRGRAGRQGDPGRSRFYVSLEDDLMRLFGSDRIASLMTRMGMQEGEMMQHRWLTRSIEQAQKRVEGRNFEIRKRTLEYDDVMNKQRRAIYGRRRETLLCDDLGRMSEIIVEMSVGAAEKLLGDYADIKNQKVQDWDIEGFLVYLHRYCPYADFSSIAVDESLSGEDAANDLLDKVEAKLVEAYDAKRQLLTDRIALELSRRVVLLTIDGDWRDHLVAVDELRESVWTASYAQKEPLVEYQRIASEMFQDMVESLNRQVFQHYFLTQVVISPQQTSGPRIFFRKQTPDEFEAEMAARQAAQAQAAHPAPAEEGGETAAPHQGGGGAAPAHRPAPPKPQTFRRETPKVGPNDPCPCGSGKKYKKCHGSKQLAGTTPQNEE